MGDYKPQEIERKWQKRWEEHRVFETEADLGETQEEGKSKPAPLNTKGAAHAELRETKDLPFAKDAKSCGTRKV